MEKFKAKIVDPSEVPEVNAYMMAKLRLDAFREQYPEIFEEFTMLVEQHNAALEEADKVLRPQQLSCGPFHCYSVTIRYDAEALLDAVGPERFGELGGRVVNATEYELDRDRFEKCIPRLPREVVERVRNPVPNYHMPKRVKLS